MNFYRYLSEHFIPIMFVVFVSVAVVGLANTVEQPTQETTITCTTNDSKIHYDDGWKKIETVDYYRIGALIQKGKAEWQCKPGTLVCTAFIEGKAFPETKGCAWYWRKT